MVIQTVLVLATLVLYAPTTGFSFLNWDDQVFTVGNRYVAGGLTWEGIKWGLGTGLNGMWHPLTWMSFMLDVSIGGMNPATFHMTNIWLHLFNVVLVFRIGDKLFHSLEVAGSIAAVFAWHPVNVETVAWIAERKGLLSAFFTFLALSRYIDHLRAPARSSAYLLAVVWHLCATLSKGSAVVVPGLLLILNFLAIPADHRRGPRGLLLDLAPFLAIAGAGATVTFGTEAAANAVAHLSWDFRAASILAACLRYLGHLVFPADLAGLYARPTFWEPSEVAWLLAIAGLVVLGIFSLRGGLRPPLLLGLAWFGTCILPVSGIAPFGPHYMADRYAYVSFLGLMACGVLAVAQIPHLGVRRLVKGMVAAFLIASTAGYLPAWRNSETLWSNVLATQGPNGIAWNNYGRYLMSEGRLREAAKALRASLVEWVGNDLAYANLSLVYAKLGEPRLEQAYAQLGLEAQPWSEPLLIRLGDMHRRRMQHREAYMRYYEAFRLERSSRAAGALALLLYTSPEPAVRDRREAIRMARLALKLDEAGVDDLVARLAAKPEPHYNRNDSTNAFIVLYAR
jgi:hypothetical protein